MDPETSLDMLYGPMHYRLIVQHEPLTRAFLMESVDAALRAMLVHCEEDRWTTRSPDLPH